MSLFTEFTKKDTHDLGEGISIKTSSSVLGPEYLIFRCSRCGVEAYKFEGKPLRVFGNKNLTCDEYIIRDILE